LKTNVERVLTDRPDLQLEVINCIKEGSALAVDIKRKAQGLIGAFLEKLQTRMKVAEESKRQEPRKAGKAMLESERLKARRDAVTIDERDTLDYLCGRVEPMVNKCGDDDADDSQGDSGDLDAEGKGNKHVMFLRSFLTYLYSRNLPDKNSKIGKAVNTFINILVGLQLFDICRNRGELNESMLFTASSLARSVAGQLSVELTKMYNNCSHLLYDQVRIQVLLTRMSCSSLLQTIELTPLNLFTIGQSFERQGTIRGPRRYSDSGKHLGRGKLPCPQRAHSEQLATRPHHLLGPTVCDVFGA